MLISCTWLNDLLEGSPISVGPAGQGLNAAAIAKRLTGLGLEVEGVKHFDLPGVIVGEIREVVDHPEASRLHVVQLFDGAQVLQVVCGANNLPPPGGKVAFAPVGTTLPGGLTLAARELRGVASQGMICSEDEIDLGSDHDGIVILPSEWAAGTPLVDLVPALRDSVIEIGVTPNRPDALGHVGVAIDLAVALAISTRSPRSFNPADLPTDAGLVEIAAGDRCGRYLGYALEGVKVDRSPLWLRTRLHRVGLRAINDVVDVTNYVLMETGQPIHAFDRAKLAEGRVVVRRASAGEPLKTLDGREVALVEDDLAIADAARPAALAGVMGGAESAVDHATSTLLLEVAWFEPRGVRRSARRHGFHTDASHRYERGVDHGGKLELAAKRALQLLVELTGGKPIAKAEALGERPAVPEIVLRPTRIRELLGMDIAADEAARVLSGLGIRVDRANASAWRCRAPSFRPDLRREVDLIEEVMRHHGLDDLPAVHSVASSEPEPIPEDPRRAIADALTDALRGAGLHEHLGLAFSSDEALAAFAGEVGPERRVRLANPLRQQYAVLRSHLLPGLLDAVAVNHARHDRAIGLFESGRVYRWPSEPPTTSGPTALVDAGLPEEPRRVGAIQARRGGPQADAPLTRALIQTLLAALESLDLWAIAKPAAPVEWLHPGVQVGLWIHAGSSGAKQIGLVGEVHPDLSRARGLDELELAYGELWIDELLHDRQLHYRELARFPASARDLSLDLSIDVPAQRVVEVIGEVACGLASEQAGQADGVVLESSSDARSTIELREDWRGRGVGEGRRALLLRLHYRARERSVTDAEVQALHESLVERACARLRDLDPDLRVR
ncbi:phenylalanine--tRNA ligase subunit beta [Nannocystaceae bacterium ST9]